MAKSEYKALVGLNYGDKRVEAGEVVSDIPKESIAWLLANGAITADVATPTSTEVLEDSAQTPIVEENPEPTPSEPFDESDDN